MNKKAGSEERRAAVIFKPSDLTLIRKHTFLGGPVEERLRIGEATSGGVRVRLTAEDLDELLGTVAAAANHPDSPNIQRDRKAPHERLQRLEDSLGSVDED